jgi:NusA N-terminal domain.
MAAVSANKLELLQIADAVAREKSIDRSIVIAAMEDAIAKAAARARYGSETDVHAEIDAKKGELRLSRHMLVVEQVENSSNQISLRMRGAPIRCRRSATPSPTPCRRWNMAASPRNPPSR